MTRLPWSQRFFLIFHRMGELRESREAANTSREAARKKLKNCDRPTRLPLYAKVYSDLCL